MLIRILKWVLSLVYPDHCRRSSSEPDLELSAAELEEDPLPDPQVVSEELRQLEHRMHATYIVFGPEMSEGQRQVLEAQLCSIARERAKLQGLTKENLHGSNDRKWRPARTRDR